MNYDSQTDLPEKYERLPTEADSHGAPREASLADDLLWIFEVVRNNLLWPLLALMLSLAAALAYLYTAKPLYTAKAQILINTQEVKVTGGASVFSGLAHDPQLMDTKLAVLNSMEVAKRALGNLNLSQEELFAERLEEEKVLPTFMKLVRTGREGLSKVLWVESEHEQPKIALRIADEYAKAFLADERSHKSSIIGLGNEWLAKRTKALRERTLKAEGEIQSYKAKLKLVSSGGKSLGELELEEAAKQLVSARRQRVSASARLSQLEQAASNVDQFSGLSDVLDSRVIGKYRELSAEINGRIAKLTNTFGEKHSRVDAAKAELSRLEQEIGAEIRRIMEKYRNEFDIATSQVEALEREMETLKQRLVEDGKFSLKLVDLTREAQATREIYNSFLKRLNETQGQERLEVADARIISYASMPIKPSRPNKRMTVALLAGLALAISMIGILAKETIYTYIRSPADIRRMLGLSTVAEFEDNQDQSLSLDDASYMLERGYTAMRYAIMESAHGEGGRIAAVISANRGEGRTINAYNIAMNAAGAGINTLLVDCDFMNSELSNTFAPDSEDGWEAAVLDDVPRSDLYIVDDNTRMKLLPLRKVEDPLTALQLVDDDKLGPFFEELRQEFELIVLDTAPLLGSVENRILLKNVDDALLVIEQGRSTQQEIDRSIEKDAGLQRSRIVGAVLNKMRRKKLFYFF